MIFPIQCAGPNQLAIHKAFTSFSWHSVGPVNLSSAFGRHERVQLPHEFSCTLAIDSPGPDGFVTSPLWSLAYVAPEQLDESINWPALNLADQDHWHSTMISITRGLRKAAFCFQKTGSPFEFEIAKTHLIVLMRCSASLRARFLRI
jgi:hypothetical protein